MTQQGKTVVAGGNGSTAYNLGGPECADPLALRGLSITIPWPDKASSTIQFETRTDFSFMENFYNGSNLGDPTSDLINRLSAVWCEVISNPGWKDVLEDQPVINAFVEGGETFFIGRNLKQVSMIITNISAKINYWWNTDDFGKYGFLQWGRGIYGQPQWINSKSFYSVYPEGTTDGFKINLATGLIGVVVARGPLQIPPLQWSTSSGSGQYPNYPVYTN